ncbi:BTAD domain-containing putative transcriptional regulator [Streptomyces sp. CME 23]|uniref:BTAD domain-containing putative transcriptional regulator n=1 Tax=Streptomyces gilvus TaxID=2920937 RepID=UPI001F101A52|nr:BTAD domain-containing putative transcriptional regulator [Streptomyces sp. CME 23]MCH5675074.1 tetratricopeptide repeat protein [Streptomyces sp. CME 23]
MGEWRELRFGLLGSPVLYEARGEASAEMLSVGSPKLRTLLAALLLEAGRVVSVESLKDALWGGAPPASAQASLHNHVARLRRLLDDPERLRSVPPGYVLRVEQGELDVHVFERHFATARGAHAVRNWERVVRECAAALSLWRGTPLSGLPAELGGYSFTQRLQESRLLLLEWRYDAELAVPDARPDTLVPELTALTTAHPLRESFHRQLMLALHHTGRQAEALEVHRALRARLRNDLGVEPGQAVRQTHVRILRSTQTAAAPANDPTPAQAATGNTPSPPAPAPTADGTGSVPAATDATGTSPVPAVEAADAAGTPHRSAPAAMDAAGTSPVSVPASADGTGIPHRSAPTADGTGIPPVSAPTARDATITPHPSSPAAAEATRTSRVPEPVAGDATGTPPASAPAAAEAARTSTPNSHPPAPADVQSAPQGPPAPDDESVTGGAGGNADPAPNSPAPDDESVTGRAGGNADPAPNSPAPDDESVTGRAGGNADPAPNPPAPHDESVTDGVAGPPPPAPNKPAPAQLPPPPAHFTGRTAETETLLAAAAQLPPLTVITGMPGIGKTALALHVAHAVKNRFPDGQLYINLHGATPCMTPLTPIQSLTALLRDLGTTPRDIPEHPDAASALLRTLLAPTRTLLLLDDAATAAQIRPLLPAGPGCAVIVTSRSPLTTLDGATRHPLTLLSTEESAALLRAVSGRDTLDATHPLVELTGRLPLALRVVAARLAARRALTPDTLAGQLTASGSRLSHLEYDDLSVRRSLAVAHDSLAASDREADRDAALLLRGVGVLDLPTYGAPILARLSGIDDHRAEAALDRLVDVALLEETTYGRYAPHDLVRDFTRELSADAPRKHSAGAPRMNPADAPRANPTDAPRANPTDASREHPANAPQEHPADFSLRWYAAVSEHALTAIVPAGPDQDDRRRPTDTQPADHAPYVDTLPAFESSGQAFAWADTELENVVTLVRRHADDPDPRRTAYLSTLVRLLFPYLHRSGRVAEMEVLGTAALGVARRLGDPAAEACALVDLAGLHFLTGRHQRALALTDQALALWRRLNRPSWIRRCLNNRGLLLEGLGRYEESGSALRQSLEYSRQLNDPYGEAVTHSHLGNLYEHTDPRAAIEQHRRSLAVGDEIGAVIVRHSAHCNIGYAHLTLGEPVAALPHFEESLRILGGHGDWHGESQTRLGLVRALRLLGRTERAVEECERLLRHADSRADRYTGGLARHQHGLLLRASGRDEEARDQWRAALKALEGTDERATVAELGELLAQQG